MTSDLPIFALFWSNLKEHCLPIKNLVLVGVTANDV